MAAKKKTPAWVWIGCGCLLLVLLVLVLIGGAGFWGVSQFTSMIDDMADPLARDEATMRLLGAEKLPVGWHSHVFFQIPFILKIAILTDGAPGEKIEGNFEEKTEALENLRLHPDDFDRNLFVYFKIKGRGDEPVEELLAGKTNRRGHTNTDMDLDIEIEEGESLGEGTLERGQQTIEWRASTGRAEMLGDTLDGIYAAAVIRCPSGDSADAVWFQAYEKQAEGAASTEATGSAVAAAAEAEEAPSEAPPLPAIEGTPADPAALEWLFGHFELCG